MSATHEAQELTDETHDWSIARIAMRVSTPQPR